MKKAVKAWSMPISREGRGFSFTFNQCTNSKLSSSKSGSVLGWSSSVAYMFMLICLWQAKETVTTSWNIMLTA